MIKIPKDASNTGKDGYKNEVTVLTKLNDLVARDDKSLISVQKILPGVTIKGKLKDLITEQLKTRNSKADEIDALQNQFADALKAFHDQTGLVYGNGFLDNALVDKDKVNLIGFEFAHSGGSKDEFEKEIQKARFAFQKERTETDADLSYKLSRLPWTVSLARRTSVTSE